MVGTGCWRSSARYLDGFWQRADVELEGRPRTPTGDEIRALPYTPGRCERPSNGAIAAKGLTGPGYDGHTFWDTEAFVLPVLTYTDPRPPPDALAVAARGRSISRGSAREQLEPSGRAVPWRTIDGEECSGYWPAGTAAFHINADIAEAVVGISGAGR